MKAKESGREARSFAGGARLDAGRSGAHPAVPSRRSSSSSLALCARWLLISSLSLLGVACFETEKGEPFYGRVATPKTQEFRWSDGGLPRVFDPALAAAPPDTDAVRALFEGLTDYDPRTLEPVAAVATHWEASTDFRQWTFHLRRDARWSNGDAVTAQDFVRSWQRTLRLGDRAPHARLLENIEGAQSAVALVVDPSQAASEETGEVAEESLEEDAEPKPPATSASPTLKPTPTASPTPAPVVAPKFGAEAVGDYVLKVRLRRPDRSFPALVAHPVFRPVHASDRESEAEGAQEELEDKEGRSGRGFVSNGAFRLSGLASDSVVLERASSYWDAGAVALERVRFIAARDAESALAAYERGEVDAVTNAAFEPLALKLLAPYKDFRRATYGALTFYSFNLSRPPFNDRRVREALAIALDRDRLSADAMSGATEPAKRFLPLQHEESGEAESAQESSAERADELELNADEEQTVAPLEFNAERARRLLAEAGFPGGAGFPRIRLLVNRNEQHRMMAQAVAAMWRSVLGVETEVVVRSWEEYEAALWTGDYDIARRSMVMQTTDAESNMLAIFERQPQAALAGSGANETAATATPGASETPTPSPRADDAASSDGGASSSAANRASVPQPILSEAQALRELPAIPVYFASSFAVVKPYVRGFDTNLLDAPSLKHVRIDTDWKMPEETKTVEVIGNE
ncbi:MAG TPA: ABC transporter substrate-binding protein [Pyrinomonadaceae bacterium]|jgi:ABC-type oligopeptide transport system substrate-binding subunit